MYLAILSPLLGPPILIYVEPNATAKSHINVSSVSIDLCDFFSFSSSNFKLPSLIHWFPAIKTGTLSVEWIFSSHGVAWSHVIITICLSVISFINPAIKYLSINSIALTFSFGLLSCPGSSGPFICINLTSALSYTKIFSAFIIKSLSNWFSII